MVHPRSGSTPATVIGVGVSSCLGGHVSAAAAARAQMTRFQQLFDMRVRDDDTNEMVPLVGAPAAAVAMGFDGMGRIVLLAVAAIDDLLANAPQEVDFSRAGFFLALTAPEAVEEEEKDDDEINFEEPFRSPQSWAEATADRIAEHSGHFGNRTLRRLYLEGRSGTARAVRDAIDSLARRAHDHVVVLAVDSSIDQEKLDHLLQQRRLKTPSGAVGLMPGEAAVAVLLSRSRPAGVRSADAMWLYDPIIELEHPSLTPAGRGRLLATVMMAASATAASDIGTLYVDLNGEEARATEFGAAVGQMPAASPFRVCRQEFPAIAFGETGAASPLLGIALAMRALSRGYAHGATAVVLVTSTDGMHAALVAQSTG